MTSRRTFLETGLPALLTVGFLDTLLAAEAVPPSVSPILAGWLRDLHGRCADLRGGACRTIAPRHAIRSSRRSRVFRSMDFVDPRRSQPLGDGTIRAPRLGADEVFARYGKTGA